MTRRPLLILTLLCIPTLAFGQATKPATKAVWLSIANGEVRYTVPEGWNVVPITEKDGMSEAFKNEDGNGLMKLHANPQQQPIPTTPAVAQSLGKQILKAIRADLDQSKAEILEEPKLERDPRFLVRIRDRIRLNGVTSDRMHLYRAMGYNLVQVVIDVDDRPAEEVKAAFGAGQELLAGAVAGKRETKPSTTRPTPRKRP